MQEFWEIIKVYFTNKKVHLNLFIFTGYAGNLGENILNLEH
jgi:hypothetical protein